MKASIRFLISLLKTFWFDLRQYRKTKRLYKCLDNVTALLESQGFGGHKYIPEEEEYKTTAVRWIRETRLPVIETISTLKVTQIPGFPAVLRPGGVTGLKIYKN
jgi:hypothetical protein